MIPTNRSITGGIIMLACAAIHPVSQRQHLAAPDTYTTETVAAGTVVSLLIPIREFLHEALILQTHPTPLYIDSKSTVDVACNDASAKRSIWTIRRAIVIQELATLDVVRPILISEADNVADIMTKYLVHKVWLRHVLYLLNSKAVIPALTIQW
jgi:hypothetical protein